MDSPDDRTAHCYHTGQCVDGMRWTSDVDQSWTCKPCRPKSCGHWELWKSTLYSRPPDSFCPRTGAGPMQGRVGPPPLIGLTMSHVSFVPLFIAFWGLVWNDSERCQCGVRQLWGAPWETWEEVNTAVNKTWFWHSTVIIAEVSSNIPEQSGGTRTWHQLVRHCCHFLCTCWQHDGYWMNVFSGGYGWRLTPVTYLNWSPLLCGHLRNPTNKHVMSSSMLIVFVLFAPRFAVSFGRSNLWNLLSSR